MKILLVVFDKFGLDFAKELQNRDEVKSMRFRYKYVKDRNKEVEDDTVKKSLTIFK